MEKGEKEDEFSPAFPRTKSLFSFQKETQKMLQYLSH
jgi:hypothetical protein